MPTEAKDIFEANSLNVRGVFCERGLGLYVPPYQRPYGWDSDKVGKLIEDILHGYASLIDSEESFAFLGTVITIHDRDGTTVHPIVRTELPARVLTVIDGQQRLTTLLLLIVALHNHLRLSHAKLLRTRGGELTPAEMWLDGQARSVIDELGATFCDRHAHGDSPLYPRMIRAFDDQWSRTKANAKYKSAIANLISAYFPLIDAEKPTEYKPTKRDGRIEGEDALVARYAQLSKILKAISLGGLMRDELEEFPSLKNIARTSHFQRALVNHEFPDDVLAVLSSNPVPSEFAALINLTLLANYTLTRVALTVVRGKNEDYAFTVFESLNTTGEPLTAFETFKPRVVSAEGIERYEQSICRAHLTDVSNYLSTFKVGDSLQAATRDLLIYFASAETGFKLSKRLADQRRYMKTEFERYESDSVKRVEFVRHLRDTTAFVQSAWVGVDKSPTLLGLPIEASTDVVKLCLAFLRALNHTIALAPLVRFYSSAIIAADNDKARMSGEFEEALKAFTAFSVLWRASHRGTAGIDQEYRDILAGNNSVTGLPPLARSLQLGAPIGAVVPTVDISWLKRELRARLGHRDHGAVPSKEQFLLEASPIPAYMNSRPVSRFLLLAAYHDAIEDTLVPGLIVKGREAVSPCLTYKGFLDERHLSLEHIAPQNASPNWPEELYATRDIVHQLGNLVLVPLDANSMLSDRAWSHKRVLYKALGAASVDEAAEVLRLASQSGIEFGDGAKTVSTLAAHMPHLTALGQRDVERWDEAFISERSKRLLGLAWDKLDSWLK